MTDKQRLEIRSSEIRERLNEIAGTEDLTDEVRPAGNALRLSGAAALLSPWRVRRAIRDEDD